MSSQDPFLRLLFLGDIVGDPGRRAVASELPVLKEELGVDFTVVNGENSAGGRGITGKIAIGLMRAGAAVITTGDHVWDQPDTASYIETEPRLLRPINYPDGVPGKGTVLLETAKAKVGVINVQGRSFMQPPMENPFHALDRAVTQLRRSTPVIFVDVHAETTSEKIAVGRYLDGRVSAVVGTHTHVQTADEQILPAGTAFLCDAGMCGPDFSILGRTPDPIIEKFKDGMPRRFPVAKGDVRLCGALVTIEPATGMACSIERINRIVPIQK